MTTLQDFAKKHIKTSTTWSGSSKANKLWFNVERYLSTNRGFSRDQMPQIDFKEFMAILSDLSTVTSIRTSKVPVMSLHATQNEINISKVLRNIVKGKVVDKSYIYIIDKNGYILDGHHRHVQTLIQDKHRLVDVIQFVDVEIDELVHMFTNVIDSTRKDIDGNIVESYGSGDMPAPGMGAVALPVTVTSTGAALDSVNHGSGDIPGTQKKKKYSVNKATGEKFEIDDSIDVLTLPFNEEHPLWDIMDESYDNI